MRSPRPPARCRLSDCGAAGFRKGPFWLAKRTVRQAGTASFGMPNAPLRNVLWTRALARAAAVGIVNLKSYQCAMAGYVRVSRALWPACAFLSACCLPPAPAQPLCRRLRQGSQLCVGAWPGRSMMLPWVWYAVALRIPAGYRTAEGVKTRRACGRGKGGKRLEGWLHIPAWQSAG